MKKKGWEKIKITTIIINNENGIYIYIELRFQLKFRPSRPNLDQCKF